MRWLKKLWPWKRCWHVCDCYGNTLLYGHMPWCPYNHLHPRWHRQ